MRPMMRLCIILILRRSLCVCVRLGVTFTFIFINFYNQLGSFTVRSDDDDDDTHQHTNIHSRKKEKERGQSFIHKTDSLTDTDALIGSPEPANARV